jgi:hypothetical protein
LEVEMVAFFVRLPRKSINIILNRQFIHGSISIDWYAEVAILTAAVTAFLTTPFDVARTRILIDSDGDFSNGIDRGSGKGVFKVPTVFVRSPVCWQYVPYD